ncbi:hypothetical protein AGLY_003218 [Aphis glycines]|uniref:Uncharacterized protein n=1 Tax=Aphis glycines TaxID=307491 RepID=A0A6G0U2X3_APHGL|nr:hypothetical protein AGLY_003218 [Aphis glycines]
MLRKINTMIHNRIIKKNGITYVKKIKYMIDIRLYRFLASIDRDIQSMGFYRCNAAICMRYVAERTNAIAAIRVIYLKGMKKMTNNSCRFKNKETIEFNYHKSKKIIFILSYLSSYTNPAFRVFAYTAIASEQHINNSPFKAEPPSVPSAHALDFQLRKDAYRTCLDSSYIQFTNDHKIITYSQIDFVLLNLNVKQVGNIKIILMLKWEIPVVYLILIISKIVTETRKKHETKHFENKNMKKVYIIVLSLLNLDRISLLILWLLSVFKLESSIQFYCYIIYNFRPCSFISEIVRNMVPIMLYL